MSYPLEPPFLGCGRKRVSLNTRFTLTTPYFRRHLATSSSLWRASILMRMRSEESREAAGRRRALCSESASRSGGGCRGKAALMGGINDVVRRVLLVEGWCLRTISGDGGGRQSWRRQQLQSIFTRWTENSSYRDCAWREERPLD